MCVCVSVCVCSCVRACVCVRARAPVRAYVRECVWPRFTAVKNREKNWGEMEVNGPGGSKLGRGRNSWQQTKHAWQHSDLLHSSKEIISQL